MTGAAGIDIGAGAVVLAAVLAAGTLILLEILGTTLRAIGRGFGNGTSGLAQASPADTDNATASVRPVANAVVRNAATREDGVTAFLRGESLNRSSPGSILIEYVDKTLNTPDAGAVCANTTAKSRLCLGASGPFAGSSDPILIGGSSKQQSRKPRVRRESMAAKTNFRGSFTALVTPFKNGSLDEAAFRGLVSWQIAEGTHGLVPVGTTGESPTVSHDEHKRVVEWCIDEARGRVPVIAGAGSNSTKEAIELAEHAEQAGASAVLVVTPYYNKPTQEGLYQHFKAINDAIGIPIIIYNIPPRSVIDMTVDTMARLFELKNIAGVKDATASMVRVSQQRAQLGEDFNQLSGEDATVLGYMAHGGHGCISVTSNIAPRLCSEFHVAWQRGDVATALKVHDKLMPLHTNLFLESNPSPVKYALSLLGKMDETLRLPMVPVSEPTRAAVRSAMVHAGLIN
jgi:4-hydroxy-tetrahydrodipicolinate synthase